MNKQTGANVDPNADPGDMLQSNTRGLMAAMSTLPELTERKRTIDKHTTLLGSIVKAGRAFCDFQERHQARSHPLRVAGMLCASAGYGSDDGWSTNGCTYASGRCISKLLKCTLGIHYGG